MNIKVFFIKAQEFLDVLIHNKIFIGFICLLLVGTIVSTFTQDKGQVSTYDYLESDTLEKQNAERQVEEEMNVSMSEVNRLAKLITYFFKSVIEDKSYQINGISEDYENITEFDMQIIDIEKNQDNYKVRVQIGIPKEGITEKIFESYKRYEATVLSTNAGFRVDTLKVIE